MASLRIALQAGADNPEMLTMLGPSMLTELDELDRRLLQLSGLARADSPDLELLPVDGVIRGWLEERGHPASAVQLPAQSLDAQLDSDLWCMVFDELWRNGAPAPRLALAVEDDSWVLTAAGPTEGLEELREWLFDPAETTLRHGKVALGLPLARRVAEGHGGTLTLRPGEVCLRVPRGSV